MSAVIMGRALRPYSASSARALKVARNASTDSTFQVLELLFCPFSLALVSWNAFLNTAET